MNRTMIKLIAVCFCVGCAAQGNSFERHSLSRISAEQGSGADFIFETREVPGLGRDDPAAEAVRMQWLSEWLSVRGACKSGYEIAERRLFEARDYNPHQSEFRFAVRCRTAQGT